jgi:hypothetical protein
MILHSQHSSEFIKELQISATGMDPTGFDRKNRQIELNGKSIH